MMADTVVINKPSTSRLIKINLCLKLTTGGFVIAFFDTCRTERARGLRSGLASGLTIVGLRGVTGLFIRKSIKAYKHNSLAKQATATAGAQSAAVNPV
jgi:hypothetical protein